MSHQISRLFLLWTKTLALCQYPAAAAVCLRMYVANCIVGNGGWHCNDKWTKYLNGFFLSGIIIKVIPASVLRHSCHILILSLMWLVVYVCIYRNKITIATLAAASFILTCCLVLVMANEFPSLPKKLIKFSSSFSLRRRDRSLFVIFVITTLALATGLNIVSVHFSFPLSVSHTMLANQHLPYSLT